MKIWKINPNGDFQYKIIKFGKSEYKRIFQDCDIIIEGFDKRVYKVCL